MSLDESRNWKHAQMVDDPDEPEWRRIARRTEAEEREARRREDLELMLSESVEAEEARWANWFAASAKDRPVVHYEGGSTWTDRRLLGGEL